LVQAPSRGIHELVNAPFGSHVLSPAEPHARHFSLVSPHQVASQVLKFREQHPFEPVGAGVTGELVTGAGFAIDGVDVLDGDLVGGDVVGPLWIILTSAQFQNCSGGTSTPVSE